MNSSNDPSSERYSQNKINDTNKQTKQKIYGMGLFPDT